MRTDRSSVVVVVLIVSLSDYVSRKAEIEARRKAEEAERLRQEEADRRAAEALQVQMKEEAAKDLQYREQLEQERRDYEIASRLANESNGQVIEMPTLPQAKPLVCFFICPFL